jgi:hypothetical protein
MKMRDFIRKHRTEIDDTIRGACSNIGRLSDDERENWIMNDEGLYNWARREGVRV